MVEAQIAPASVGLPPPASFGRRIRYGLTDAAALTKRNLLHLVRVPALIVFTAIQPIMFTLLFRYVFGGAIKVPSGVYVDFLIPGIIIQTAAFASFGTATNLADELSKGVIDRFRSLPIARSAVLVGRLASDVLRITFTICVIVAIGYAIGFRFHEGVGDAVAMVLLGVGFGLSVCTVSAFIGLAVKDPESVQTFGLIWLFPLTFASGVFVPVQSMPSSSRTSRGTIRSRSSPKRPGTSQRERRLSTPSGCRSSGSLRSSLSFSLWRSAHTAGRSREPTRKTGSRLGRRASRWGCPSAGTGPEWGDRIAAVVG
jgi:ABC transporter DrrB family efflux protein